jgi:hypothetical protein
LGRPRNYFDVLFHISIDDFPNLVFGKGFIFEDYMIPFFPHIPHEDACINLPGFVNDGVAKMLNVLGLYISYSIIFFQVCSSEIDCSLIP